jgi:hypothetical protein
MVTNEDLDGQIKKVVEFEGGVVALATSDSAFELPPADRVRECADCSALGEQMAGEQMVGEQMVAAGRCVKETMSVLATCLNMACSMVVRARREVADTPATLRQDAWVQVLALARVAVCTMHASCVTNNAHYHNHAISSAQPACMASNK